MIKIQNTFVTNALHKNPIQKRTETKLELKSPVD